MHEEFTLLSRPWVSALAVAVFLPFAFKAAAQTNIAVDGSFEASIVWTMVGGGGIYHGDWRAADGTNWLEPAGYLYQDLPTVPGHDYIVKFALGNYNSVRVRWGGTSTDINIQNSSVSSSVWQFTNVLFAATTNLTRLQLESISGSFRIDAVEVGWAEEPPSILIPVPSRSTFEGGSASFAVAASGGPPLSFQWYRNSAPLAGATSRVVTLTNVTGADQGSYWVRVTNSFGAIDSLRAELVVNSLPQSPFIVAQPKPQSVLEGYGAGFYVVALGQTPLSYQWRLNGTDIPSATSAGYVVTAAGATNAGDYSVMVSNQFGTSLSITSALAVTTGSNGGGNVLMANRVVTVLDAPVFDVDGTTRVYGSNYLVQLCSGATPYVLRPVGVTSNFRSSPTSGAGYFYSATKAIPNVPFDQTAYIQVRVWNSDFGKTYEEAQARGGKFGKSNILPVVTGDPQLFVPSPTFLLSFRLQAGLSPLATAKIERGSKSPNGQVNWLLIGDPGCQYVVERSSPPNDWTPFLTLTNETGVVEFNDPDGQNEPLRFYRARIIEP